MFSLQGNEKAGEDVEGSHEGSPEIPGHFWMAGRRGRNAFEGVCGGMTRPFWEARNS